MIRRLTLACVGIALCAAGATQLFAAGPETAAATKAGNYIRALQNSDGGFPDATTSSPGATIDASFAFASLGVDPKTVKTAGKSPADYLSSQAPVYSASTAGGAAKLVLGIVTLNLDATTFGGINPLSVMEANYNAATGQYGTDLFAQAYFILAEAALHRPIAPLSVSYVESLQHADGGWEDCCGFGEDTNTTGLIIRTLIAGGVPASDQHVVDGLAYFKAGQQADGGFPYAAPAASDPDSTAFVIQAIVAAGQSVEAGSPWEKSAGKTPLGAMLTFQNQATGALQFFGADSLFATYQGIPGLMLDAFPEQHTFTQNATATATTSTGTATRTQTPTATATSSPTPSSTFTPIPNPATATAPASAISTQIALTTAPAATATTVRSVLGEVAVPTRLTSVLPSTRLPSTGSGPAPNHGLEPWLLLLCGGLALTGSIALRRARR